MPGQDFEVAVRLEDRDRSADGGSAYEAVDQLSNRFPLAAAAAVYGGGVLVVRRLRRYESRSSEQAAQVVEVAMVKGAGEHFHPDRVARGDVAVQDGIDSVANDAAQCLEGTRPRRRCR